MIGRLGREQRGFTLVESLVAATMMVGVVGTVLTTIAELGATTTMADAQNDAQQEARRALGVLAKELRNLASPTNELPQAVERAQPSDLVFQSVAATRPAGSANARNTMRVRYCFDQSSGSVRRYEQTWTTAAPPAMPAATDCTAAAAGWTSSQVVAHDVRNGDRPLFAYNAADVLDVTEVHVRLFVDADPATRPAEVPHETTLFLRNQNRGPTASFSATASGSQILLNGSGSEDPEGKALEYYWYDNGGSEPVGEGIVFTYAPPQPGTHAMELRVRDPAGLEHRAQPQEVCIVGGEATCQ